MTRAVTLYAAYSLAELRARDAAIRADPASAAKPGGQYVYTRKARQELDDLYQAIVWAEEDEQR